MKKLTAVLISISILAFALSACIKDTGAKEGKNVPVNESNNDYNIEDIKQDIVDSNSEFAFDIFKKLNAEASDESIFISPLSISAALTMAYNGAGSSTKEGMGKALRFGDLDAGLINESYKNLLNYLGNADDKIELNISNSIWIREGVKIKEDFLSVNRDAFNAEIAELNFSENAAVDTINNWISEATKGKIDKMLSPPIDPQIIMYLINAIYFKGQWKDRFEPEKTFDGTFEAGNGQKQEAEMMSRKGRVEYLKGEDYKALRLPYGDGKVSMYFLLPDEDTEINRFVADFTMEKWMYIGGNISPANVELQIPKFKLEYGSKTLNDSLKSLGMEEAFSDSADFSGISDNVSISRVMHKAVIEVNEEGSEAAAVTVVEMQSVSANREDPITFIADRPFMFIIADDTKGSILFMGKLWDAE